MWKIRENWEQKQSDMNKLEHFDMNIVAFAPIFNLFLTYFVFIWNSLKKKQQKLS